MNISRNIIELKPIYKASLEQNIERYRSVDREIKKLQKVADELKANIILEMGSRTEVCNSDGQVIATYTPQNRTGFDRVTFETDYPGIYEKYSLQSETKVFRLK